MNCLLSLYRSLDSYVFYNEALIKSDNAYKYKFANTIIHVEDTIAQGSYFAESSQLQVRKAPEGRESSLYFDSSHEFPINFLRFDIPNDIEEFRVDIECKIYIKNDDIEKSLHIVRDLQDISYKKEILDIDYHNMWYTYKHTLIYKKEMWENLKNNSLLKIYLWNLDKLEGYIDDIKIKVKTLDK
jgi:hypothetical protein